MGGSGVWVAVGVDGAWERDGHGRGQGGTENYNAVNINGGLLLALIWHKSPFLLIGLII